MAFQRVNRDTWYMGIARQIALRSTCSRLYVGAIAVRGQRLLAAGYNGAPSGIRHCEHGEDEDTPCTRAIHAEVNVIANAAKYGVPLEGSQFYVTHSPCVSCAGLLINAGVTEVLFSVEYRDPSGVDLLTSGGVGVSRL